MMPSLGVFVSATVKHAVQYKMTVAVLIWLNLECVRCTSSATTRTPKSSAKKRAASVTQDALTSTKWKVGTNAVHW